jgi:hypothetical protein
MQTWLAFINLSIEFYQSLIPFSSKETVVDISKEINDKAILFRVIETKTLDVVLFF